MKKHFLLLFMAIVLSSLFLPAAGHAGEFFDYISDVVQCLGICFKAQAKGDFDTAETNIKMMGMLIGYREGMQTAASIMEKHIKSSDQGIQKSGKSYNHFYQSMADNEKEAISLLGNMLKDPNKAIEKPDTHALKLNEMSAKAEALWKFFIEATEIAVASMIDPNHPENGKANRLKLSKDERQELIRHMDIYFGNQIKKGPEIEKRPVVSSAVLFYSMLKEPQWKSSDEK